jgi:hypothetical protein
MARKKSGRKAAAFMSFNVTYEDGMVTSNRRVSSKLLDQSFGDSLEDLALAAIEDQDNEIAQRSGERRAKIKTIAPGAKSNASGAKSNASGAKSKPR